MIDFIDNADAVCLHIKGEHTWYWDLELMSSRKQRWSDLAGSAGDPRGIGVQSEGQRGTKLINLAVHDFGTSLFESQPSGLEIHGCLFFNSYWDAADRSHGPGLYLRNEPSAPRKRLENNIVFQHGRQGLQGFGSVPFSNFDVVGNIWFNNGIAADGFHRNLMFGSTSDQHRDNLFESNYTYFARGGGRHQHNMFGGEGGCHNLTLRDNVFAAKGRIATGLNRCDGEDVSGNRFYGRTEFESFDGTERLRGQRFRDRFPGNEYYGDDRPAPSGVWVFIRANKYLPDPWDHRRIAHVAVYNWEGASTVFLDMTSIESEGKISKGTPLTVRSAQNPQRSALLRYDGNPVQIPLRGWEAQAPAGRDVSQEPLPDTLPEFGAFILEWPVRGPAPPDETPRLLQDPGKGLPRREAWESRREAWQTGDQAERERLRKDRLFAWRAYRLGRV